MTVISASRGAQASSSDLQTITTPRYEPVKAHAGVLLRVSASKALRCRPDAGKSSIFRSPAEFRYLEALLLITEDNISNREITFSNQLIIAAMIRLFMGLAQALELRAS